MAKFIKDVDIGALELIARTALAIAIGAVIGIEREYKRKVEKEVLIFGVRTSILISVLGLICSQLAESVGEGSSLIIGLTIVAIVSTTAFILRFLEYRYMGLTTYILAFIIYLLGFMAGRGIYKLTIALAIIVVAILALKSEFHNMISGLNKEELIQAIKFGIIAFVILPFLPNDYVDPFHIFNPFRFWSIVVAVSFIGFIFFLILRKVKRGQFFLLGIIGGFVNSEVATYEISRLAKWQIVDEAIAGVLFSCFSMCLNQWILLLLVTGAPVPLVYIVVPTIFLGILVEILAYPGLLSLREHEISIKSPFSFRQALLFAGIFLLSTFMIGIANHFRLIVEGAAPYHFSGYAYLMYGVTFLCSLLAASPVVCSIASLFVAEKLGAKMATQLLLLAILGGIINKLFWCRISESKEYVRKLSRDLVILASALFIFLFTLSIYFP
ncbi:MAG: DUF4010 domain-containing protein [Candidatus Nanoarchaeia archaeon]|nr:DUF4010 domain-containing protein [Candidatus Haiyanarchaeum thermophilum]MCW1303437.1 DUF4010 domain-containing protein [Candidatus Haiyanarchaeum thermophilum]MCW1303877.1 DUF4010 domain-containing protein [Candidatus Haiyanarchaeum thermophilum]MCW1306862.1 DUF4010 domain-containing protein [Candidatus Haiyanarchaeum thermophilum]MCW1307581.1 DUF4010 domain-containing protein [Candidatus Haiyanarchaeum thermophilum]